MKTPTLHSLRTKLLLFSFFLVVVPGLLVALIAFAGAQRVIGNAVGRQLAEVARDTSSELEEAMAREQRNLRTWTGQDLMREIVIGDLDKRISRFLISLKESDAGFLDLLCVNPSGLVVAASNPALIGANRKDDGWFGPAILGKDELVGPFVDPHYGTAVLEIAAPVLDLEGSRDPIGVLVGIYDWEGQSMALADRIRNDLLPFRVKAALLILDESGTVIAESRPEEEALRAGQNLRAAGWEAMRRVSSSPRPSFVREPRTAELVGYAQLDAPRRGWSVLVTQSLEQALSPIYRMEKRLALALTGVLLAAFGVAVLLGERMSRPLRELTEATREIARGGVTRRLVEVRSRDEIGQLAGAFNTMVGELKRARDDLVAAARFAFLGEIAAGVAHEVRTPLSILRTSTQILGRSAATDRAENRELVDMIVGEVDRLDRVVTQLLELAEPHEPVAEDTPLGPLLDRVLDFVEAQAREKRIALHRDYDPGLPPARCDPEQMYQVALNLVVNALQILGTGGNITLRTRRGSQGRVAFEVSDDGPGVPAEMQTRIFTPFFTTREGGTGLGLALVERVVQAHHGTIAVDSAPRRGATFRVELPAAKGGGR